MNRNMNWNIVIGLEVHAQVISKSKLFSSASTEFGSLPNENVSIVDAAFPGVLPTLNSFCVDQAIKAGLGLNGEISTYSRFDRKNYFYADLPQGYQISQFYHPIIKGGYLDIETEDLGAHRVHLDHIHLEQDAGKSIHDRHPSCSYVDLNRSGIALMEIVTKPDMRSASEVSEFLKKLRMILRYLDVCDGNMDEGSMRADLNVSVNRPGEPLGTRVEIKNVNSIKFISSAVEFETKRQIDILESGGSVDQETRTFEASSGTTILMRSKEDAQDYRYFPDPDLPALIITSERIEHIRKLLPELPDDKIKRLCTNYNLTKYDASLIAADKQVAKFYEDCIEFIKDLDESTPKLLANWFIGEFFALLNEKGVEITESQITCHAFADLIRLIKTDVISGKIAKEILPLLWGSNKTPMEIIKEQGMEQISSPEVLKKMAEDVLAENQDKVLAYKNGKDKLFGFFVGQVMKISKGQANPTLLNDILKELLEA